MFYLVGISRTSGLGNNIPNNPEKTFLRRWGGEPGYIKVLQQMEGSLNFKTLLSQVKEFSAFLCVGRCKSLVSVKQLLWYAYYLPGPSILCFHILSFLWAHQLTIYGSCNRWQKAMYDSLCLLIWQEILYFSTLYFIWFKKLLIY